MTIVEVRKFVEGDYKEDDSRLAHWLRAIECVNNECDDGPADNPYWKNLQNAAKLCNFDMEYLLAEAKYMTDIAYEMHIERKEARAEGLAEGAFEAKREMARNMLAEKLSVAQVVKITGLSESEVLSL